MAQRIGLPQRQYLLQHRWWQTLVASSITGICLESMREFHRRSLSRSVRLGFTRILGLHPLVVWFVVGTNRPPEGPQQQSCRESTEFEKWWHRIDPRHCRSRNGLFLFVRSRLFLRQNGSDQKQGPSYPRRRRRRGRSGTTRRQPSSTWCCARCPTSGTMRKEGSYPRKSIAMLVMNR